MRAKNYRQTDASRRNPPSASAALALQCNDLSLGEIVGRALRLPTLILAITITSSLTAAEPDPILGENHQVKHRLRIIHPGDPDAKPLAHTLIQTLDKKGEPTAYSMWVDSVICRGKTCEVVKVQLHWDALGHYQRYQVAARSQLTKLDHEAFTEDDLTKLQAILKDPNSPLKEVEKESMTATAPAKASKTVDGVAAVSAPTILTLKSAVIIGAGYTCYDLWHWSNGLLTEHIRGFTGKDCSEQQMLTYLASEKTDSALFALTYANKRRITDPLFFESVINRSRKGDQSLINPTLTYLREAAPSEQRYYDALTSLFSVTDSKKRLLILESLMADSQKPVAGFYDGLCDYLPDLGSYYEVHLFLNLMKKRNAGSLKVTAKAVELLNHPKFFVSRRAHQYLQRQNLSAAQQKLVDVYYNEHKDRL